MSIVIECYRLFHSICLQLFLVRTYRHIHMDIYICVCMFLLGRISPRSLLFLPCLLSSFVSHIRIPCRSLLFLPREALSTTTKSIEANYYVPLPRCHTKRYAAPPPMSTTVTSSAADMTATKMQQQQQMQRRRRCTLLIVPVSSPVLLFAC